MAFAKVARAIVPADFYDIKEHIPAKASAPVIYTLSVAGWVILGFGFAALFGIEYTRKTETRETLILQAPAEGLECVALGAWSNEQSSLTAFTPFVSSVGIQVSRPRARVSPAAAATC